jgi:hypothetical protein
VGEAAQDPPLNRQDASATNRHRGVVAYSPLPHYLDMRVRTGRFRKIEPARTGGSTRFSPLGLRRSTGFRFGFTVFCTCKAQPRLIGCRSATRESDVLRFGPSSLS